MTVERRVEYTLAVKSDGSGSKAFDDLSRKAKSAKAEADKAGQAVAEAVGRRGAGGAAGGAAGSLSELASMAKGMAAVNIAIRGLAAGAGVGKALFEDAPSEYQRNRRLAEAIPGGRELSDFLHEAAGFNQAFRDLQKSLNETAMAADLAAKAFDKGTAFRRKASEAANAADAANVARLQAQGFKDEFADPRFGELRRAVNNADRDRLAAKWDDSDAMAEADRARRRAQAADRAVALAEGNLANLGPKHLGGIDGANDPDKEKKRLEKVGELNQALVNQQRELNRLQEAEAFAVQQTVKFKQAEFAESQAQFALDKERLAKLKEEQDKLKEGAMAFGELRAHERRAAADLAERMKAKGLDALSDADRDLLKRAGLFQKPFDEASLRAAQNDPNFERALRGANLKNFDDIKLEMQKLAPKLEVKVEFDTEKLTAGIAKEIKDLKVKIEDVTQRQIANEKDIDANRKRMGNLLGQQ